MKIIGARMMLSIAAALTAPCGGWAQSLQEQAVEQCWSELDRYWLQKGADWFTGERIDISLLKKHYIAITQVQGKESKISPINVTEADKLNGLDWHGSIGFAGRVAR